MFDPKCGGLAEMKVAVSGESVEVLLIPNTPVGSLLPLFDQHIVSQFILHLY